MPTSPSDPSALTIEVRITDALRSRALDLYARHSTAPATLRSLDRLGTAAERGFFIGLVALIALGVGVGGWFWAGRLAQPTLARAGIIVGVVITFIAVLWIERRVRRWLAKVEDRVTSPSASGADISTLAEGLGVELPELGAVTLNISYGIATAAPVGDPSTRSPTVGRVIDVLTSDDVAILVLADRDRAVPRHRLIPVPAEAIESLGLTPRHWRERLLQTRPNAH